MLQMTRESGIRMDMKEGGEADANSNLIAVGAAAYLNDEQELRETEQRRARVALPCNAANKPRRCRRNPPLHPIRTHHVSNSPNYEAEDLRSPELLEEQLRV